MELDKIDLQILRLLSKNARMQWKELGENIHMTGQAVGNRIRKLEDNDVIKSYSIVVNGMKLGYVYTSFIVIYMKSTNHESFIKFVNASDEVTEAHRVSGEGCYHLKTKFISQEQMNIFLDVILDYGNYTMHLSINEIKNQSPVQ